MKICKKDQSFLMEVENVKTDLAGKDLSFASLVNVDLSFADLRSTKLSYSDLGCSNLMEADLEGANLFKANLENSYLGGANLKGTYLKRANLSCTNFRGANLCDTNFTNTFLDMAFFKGAKYDSETKFPSPSQVLLANWGEVSSELCLKLMNYDCQNHPVGKKAFDRWAKEFKESQEPKEQRYCPYKDCRVFQRSANFIEHADIWKYNETTYTAFTLVQELMEETMIRIKD